MSGGAFQSPAAKLKWRTRHVSCGKQSNDIIWAASKPSCIPKRMSMKWLFIVDWDHSSATCLSAFIYIFKVIHHDLPSLSSPNWRFIGDPVPNERAHLHGFFLKKTTPVGPSQKLFAGRYLCAETTVSQGTQHTVRDCRVLVMDNTSGCFSPVQQIAGVWPSRRVALNKSWRAVRTRWGCLGWSEDA